MKPNLSFFICDFGILSKKSLSNPIMIFLVFFFWRVLAMFRSFIQVFMYNVEERSHFIFLHMAIKFPNIYRKIALSHWFVLAPLSKITWPCIWRVISGLSIPFVSISVIMPIPLYFCNTGFLLIFEIHSLFMAHVEFSAWHSL